MEQTTIYDPPRRPPEAPSPRRRQARGGEGRGANSPNRTWPGTDFFLLEGGSVPRLEGLRRPASARGARPPSLPPLSLRSRLDQGKGSVARRFGSPAAPRQRQNPGSFTKSLGGLARLLSSLPAPRLPRLDPALPRRLVQALRKGIARLGAALARPAARLRLAAVLGLGLLLAGLLFLFVQAATPVFPLPKGGLLPRNLGAEDDILAFLTPELAKAGPTETRLPPLPRSLETGTYTVKAGDSIARIAARNGINVDTLVSMNGITSAKGLRVGVELRIPNMNGIRHQVAKGESLGSISRRYGVTLSALADANSLGSAVIVPGQALFIPGARLAPPDLRRIFGDYLVWPARGPISSPFGYRPDPFTGIRSFHGGIDIVVPTGTPVKAVMDGRVADSGYNNLFGNYVILNHSDGSQSLYGHLSKREVAIGQALDQGTEIGLSGNTGYSTASHLHFGFYRASVAVNPLKYLK